MKISIHVRNPIEGVARRPIRIRRGFTLVELMIVIVIIIVLASLSFPLVSSVKLRSKSAASVSNLRQLGLALRVNAGESSGRLPSAHWQADDYYMKVLWEQTEGRDSPKGPHSEHYREYDGTIFWSPNWKEEDPGFMSYAMNGTFGKKSAEGQREGNNWPNDGVLLSSIRTPSRTMLMGDSWGNEKWWVDSAGYRNSKGTANILFCDGRVQPMTKSEIEEADEDRQFTGRWWGD